MRSRCALEAEETGDAERGAILLLLTVFLLIFTVVAALAVDLSALERRGQSLQNTADAAALAGVVTWQETGDPVRARARVEDLVRQNGIVGPDIVLDVSFPSDSEVTVVVGDTDPEIYLGSFVPGYDPALERAATAQLDECTFDCARRVVIPRPPNPIPASASGDGYLPISVGDRFYAINHDNNTIACVDRTAESPCWFDRYAYTGSPDDPVTGALPHHAVVGDRIWWTAQEPNRLALFCWDTSSEKPCLADYTVMNAPRADALGVVFRQRGGGLIGIDEELFVFTDDHRVHCVSAVLLSPCAGYSSAPRSTLGAAGFPPLSEATGTSGSNIDRIYDEGTGRIYHTIVVQHSALSAPAFPDTGTYLQCFDTWAQAACSGFSAHKLHDQGALWEGRLFFFRDTSGDPIGVCSTGIARIECAGLDGAERLDLESNLDDLTSELPPADSYAFNMGVHMWHEPTNRVFVTTPRGFSMNHCFDFSVTRGAYCGPIPGYAGGLGATEDYGFWYAESSNCIYALGHTSIFWAFQANDLSDGCPGDIVSTRVSPCLCAGEETWGRVIFEFDVGPAGPLTVLNIQVRDPDRNVVLPRGGGWATALGAPQGEIDLSSISTTHDYLDVFVYAEAHDETLWDLGTPPTFVVRADDLLPVLTQ